MLFLNKIDKADARVRDVVAMLQPASRTPLVLRQIPIWREGHVTGFIDLALERAFVYRDHAPSEVIAIPAARRRGNSKPASPCWSASPTTTTR